MYSAVIIIHVLAVVTLVLTVLLQAGKGAGMGAAFGGSSGSIFGARGPATLISKITCGAAVIFMCTSLFLSITQGGLKTESMMSDYAGSPVAAPAEPELAAPAERIEIDAGQNESPAEPANIKPGPDENPDENPEEPANIKTGPDE